MNIELRKVIDEIEILELKITELRKKRDEIKKAPQKEKMKLFWDKVKDGEDKTEMAMQLVAKGQSVTIAAKAHGITPAKLNQTMYKVWRKRYKKHFDANVQRIRDMGLVTALRYSPPIFTTNTK
mgnify:CR=1 FL=1